MEKTKEAVLTKKVHFEKVNLASFSVFVVRKGQQKVN